ncbi:MAG: hypothetical protein B7X88_22375 [Polaromonas sp. 17-63-33]|nr:MAG: hypothetical protein B7Y09_21910 [Polaromonas sp. 24-63-21]OZA47372.1 MAG: hypothetical protein B7X88_22375 [Polaromonas sp. 17-63-33]
MVAVTALSIIRSGDGRHVPGTPSADFEVDKKIAASLVASGAAAYADPELAKQNDQAGGGSETAGGGEGSGSDAGGEGNLTVKVDVVDPDAAKAALAAAAATTPATTAKPAAKSAPAKKVAAKKTAAKK